MVRNNPRAITDWKLPKVKFYIAMDCPRKKSKINTVKLTS